MNGKECERSIGTVPLRGQGGRGRAVLRARILRARAAAVPALVLAVGGATIWPAPATAAGRPTVRLWPHAVVVEEQVSIAALCEVTGFETSERARVTAMTVCPAPPAGGSRLVSLREVREVLAGAGFNMAEVIVKGATQCAVRRPRALPGKPGGEQAKEQEEQQAKDKETKDAKALALHSLREAVIGFFEDELRRYGGRVSVDFGHAAEAMLDLSGPQYAFDIRRRCPRALGLVELEIAVLENDRTVQKVELQPIVSLSRNAVVARRAINQGAEIGAEDVELVEMTLDRLEFSGVSELDSAIGRRAKKFLPAGTQLDPRDLETVPLVKRGQLVDVCSAVGGVSVVTAAKAMEAGTNGDTVELRDPQRKGRTMFGVVTGPRRVELLPDGAGSATAPEVRLAATGESR